MEARSEEMEGDARRHGRITRTRPWSASSRTPARAKWRDCSRPRRGVCKNSLTSVTVVRDGMTMLCGRYRRRLAQFFHYLLQHFFAGAHNRGGQSGQRFLGDVQHVEESWRLRIDVENTGQHFVFGFGLV